MITEYQMLKITKQIREFFSQIQLHISCLLCLTLPPNAKFNTLALDYCNVLQLMKYTRNSGSATETTSQTAHKK
jgi:hypothetical protein